MIPQASPVSLFVCSYLCVRGTVWRTNTQISMPTCLCSCKCTSLAWRKQVLCSLRVKRVNNYRRWPSLESVQQSNKGECQWRQMSCLLHKYNTTLPFWSELRAGQTFEWLPCVTYTQQSQSQTRSEPINANNGACTCENTWKHKHGGKRKTKKKTADVRVTGTFGPTPPGWHAAVCRPGLQC